MHATNRITIVLKPRDGENIADIAPFLSLGSTVMIGRRGAVVASLSAGDKIQQAEQLENQVILAESAMRRGIQLPETEEATESMHIDDRVRMIGAEPAFLTVVFKLPSLNDAKPLIDLLPYGQKALGTGAEVYGFSTGNLMEAEPCDQ